MGRIAIRAAQAGLTLIELMVSITIGLVVVGAMTYLYIGSKGAYRGNESLARIQEAGRFALDAITRDVRSAGVLGCGSSASLTNGQAPNVNVVAPAGTAMNAAVLYVAPVTGQPVPIVGVRPAAYTPLPTAAPGGWVPPPNPPAPTYWGGDVLQLQIAAGVAVRMSGAPDLAGGKITIADNSVAAFKATDYALLGDCSSATVFQVNSVTATAPALLSYKTSGGVIPPLNALGQPGFSIMTFPMVQHVDQVTYYVGKVPNSVSPQFPNGLSALYRYSLSSNKAEELVENVEDMDVLYGVGAGGAMAGGTFKRADTMTAADWSNVISVRVSVVGVGDQLGAAPTPQTVQVHGAGSGWVVPETRLRQVFTATAALRDRLQ